MSGGMTDKTNWEEELNSLDFLMIRMLPKKFEAASLDQQARQQAIEKITSLKSNALKMIAFALNSYASAVDRILQEQIKERYEKQAERIIESLKKERN